MTFFLETHFWICSRKWVSDYRFCILDVQNFSRGSVTDVFLLFFFLSCFFSPFRCKNLCTKYCCKSLNKQSSGVQERINPFYINSYGKLVSVYEHFGLRTAFRKELSSWAEVWPYCLYMGIRVTCRTNVACKQQLLFLTQKNDFDIGYVQSWGVSSLLCGI